MRATGRERLTTGRRGREESKGQEGGERELSRIVRLWRDVQLVEDYYLSNRRRREGEERAAEAGGGEGRGRHHVVNHGPVAPMYYIFPA